MTKLLSLEEAAKQTGYTVKALRNLIFRGKFPYLKIGGRVRIDEQKLEKFYEISQRVSPEQAAARREAA